MTKLCTVQDCENKFFCKGYCTKHYAQIRTRGEIFSDRHNLYYEEDSVGFVPIKDGRFVKIDKCDWELVSKTHWSANSWDYAAGNVGNKKVMTMHRFIIGAKKGEIVDHINNDKLDNRKTNLRICTNMQNSWNKPARNGKKLKGVHFNKINKKYIAYISADGKRHYLGSFKSAAEASLAYNNAALDLHGNFANLNLITGS